MTNSLRNQYLSAMGIDIWVSRDQDDLVINKENDPAINVTESKSTSNDIALLDWAALNKVVMQCQCCESLKSRKNSIFGSGNNQADLFIIGSIPSNEEDNSNQEFTGSEGILFDNMLRVLDLSRKDIYITNLIKCASRKHREFSIVEMENCAHYLQRQVELVDPKILIIFGQQAAQLILKTDNSNLTSSSSIQEYMGKKIFVIEHPEQLLLPKANKKDAWLSLLKIKSML